MTDRVLVLVPMRGNSQTISRKNLRGVGDTSLAATVIQRAKRLGDYLTDDGHDVIVCVSTDDTRIAGLAAANDLTVYRRQPVDATQTIAQAAFDAASAHNPTVTVVLQATSPFLPFDDLTETVDAVINGDALSASTITPVNHLAWSRTGQPLHTTRVNRQQMLPEVYTETGAVHVTRGFHPAADGGVSLVSTNHYMTETFGAAAIDIDTPDDLVAARAVHDRERRVLILVYGNTTRHGGGHLSRARLLAEELELHTTVEVWSPDIDRHPFDRWQTGSKPTPDDADRYAAVIVDMLDNTDDIEPWLAACERDDVPVIALEREHVQTRRPVLRINELAPVGELYGPRFATVDTALRGYPTRQRSSIRHVVVCFGASDPNRWTVPVVEALAEHHPALTLTAPAHCLTGDTHAAGFNPDELAYELWDADLAIIGRGRTQFEAAYLGVPFLSVAQNDNEADHWQLANGIYLNDVDDIGVNVAQAVEQIRAATQRDDRLLDNLSAGLRAEVDGRGVERVAAAIIAAMHW